MDTQNAALSKIVLEGELLPFIESRIGREFFPDPAHARIWDMVTEHFQKYGKAPDASVIAAAYPTYKFVDYPESTSFYLHQLQQDRKKVIIVSAVQEIANKISVVDEGPNIGDELEALMRRGMARAAHEISQGKDTDVYLSTDTIIGDIHERRVNGNRLRGISTGLHGIDHLTGGLQEENLITLVGTSKAGKSSMLLKIAYNAHRHGSRVLFVTFEMTTREQIDRLVSLMTGIGLTKILNGNLNDQEEQKIQEALKLKADMEGFIITSDITSAITVSGVQAKIQQYQPSLVIIDGMYLMDDETGHDRNSPQALTAITRGFKRMAQTARLPIIVSTQAMEYRARRGLKLDSIGYSSSFAQDSDIIFGVEQHEKLPGVSKFHILASRSSPRGEVYVHFDWNQGLIEELDFAQYDTMMNTVAPIPETKPGSKSAAKPSTGMEHHWAVENAS